MGDISKSVEKTTHASMGTICNAVTFIAPKETNMVEARKEEVMTIIKSLIEDGRITLKIEHDTSEPPYLGTRIEMILDDETFMSAQTTEHLGFRP